MAWVNDIEFTMWYLAALEEDYQDYFKNYGRDIFDSVQLFLDPAVKVLITDHRLPPRIKFMIGLCLSFEENTRNSPAIERCRYLTEELREFVLHLQDLTEYRDELEDSLQRTYKRMLRQQAVSRRLREELTAIQREIRARSGSHPPKAAGVPQLV